MNDLVKNLLLWVVILVVLTSVFQSFSSRGGTAQPALNYSDFLEQVRQDNVDRVHIEGQHVRGTLNNGTRFTTYSPETDNRSMIGTLIEHKVEIVGEPPKETPIIIQLLFNAFPILLLIAVWVYFMRQMQGGAGGRGAMSFGKSRARMLSADQVKVTFNDVAGVEEAKQEVAELVDFLKDPAKFQKLGGKIPRGVLMVGSPGTGKTLLAKAIAGEAKVPFFSISGSDFVEMFVGVGAARVRDMFEQ
ncbi:MAG: ATP-dependent metallopeptidase FtsH/Yme1/Tma family protein, partial [Burkholderiales bacterium]